MVEFEVRINPDQRVAYIKKEIVDQFGCDLRLMPDTNAAIIFPKGKAISTIIRSVELLLQDLRLKEESQTKP